MDPTHPTRVSERSRVCSSFSPQSHVNGVCVGSEVSRLGRQASGLVHGSTHRRDVRVDARLQRLSGVPTWSS